MLEDGAVVRGDDAGDTEDDREMRAGLLLIMVMAGFQGQFSQWSSVQSRIKFQISFRLIQAKEWI